MNFLGKLTWDALPLSEPIALIAGFGAFAIVIAIVGWVILKGYGPHLWREWITSVDHKRIGVMYFGLALIMLLRGFSDAIMMRSQQAIAAGPQVPQTLTISPHNAYRNDVQGASPAQIAPPAHGREGLHALRHAEQDAAQAGQHRTADPDRKHDTLDVDAGRRREVAFVGIRRVSRPGRRVYVGHDDIPRVLSGLGVAILSTSSGLMTDKDARRRKLGGELLCEVW